MTSGDDTRGIDYADGAESAVLAALRSAEDVSAGSAELAGQVTSAELAYHLAPQRLGLLAPLRLRPGMRVLDVGCGTGVLTRAIGDAGAEVLGIEGTAERAAAARERCRDLPGVRIVHSGIGPGLAGAGEHDMALMCGVLEYSSQFEDGPAAMLRAVAGTLAERGVLVLAIENQLGLRYLLGGTEDHRGTPWIGLADYPGAERLPRTWTRSELAAMLADAGLTAQRWLLPYPDYKFPRVVLDERILARPDAGELVDKLVREPLNGAFGGYDGAVAGRQLHRSAVAAGIAATIASSFLVLAARTDGAVAAVADPALGWLVSGARRPEWRRVRTVGADLVLRTVADGTGHKEHGAHPWLRQRSVPDEEWVPGEPLDLLLLAALRTGDEERLDELLTAWHLACRADGRPPLDTDRRHPYLPGRPGVPVLPPDCLDVHPGNFIRTPDGALARIDREWLAGGGVDAELAALRGLLEFAQEIVANHTPHPWSPNATVHDVLAGLCAPVGLTAPLADRWDELITAEAHFQEAVSAAPAPRIATALHRDYDRPTPTPLWRIPGGLTTLRADHELRPKIERDLATAADWYADRERALTDELDRQRTHVADLTTRLSAADSAADLVGLALERAEDRLTEQDRRIGMAFAELAKVTDEASTAWQAASTTESALAAERARAAELAARLTTLEASKPVRLARATLWPTGRILRGTRDLLRNRPGGEPDGVLRRAGALAPALAARYRAAGHEYRDRRLYFDVPVPAEAVVVGRGQVVELAGWVAHADMPVRAVWVRAGGRHWPATLGHPRPDVAAVLANGGVVVPAGSGIQVRVPLAEVEEPGEVALTLLVELTDGTRLSRPLRPLAVRRDDDAALAIAARWPADGPRVAVCVATYRPDAEYLAAQLESLRAQTHRNWVCVICDDGSPPESVATIRWLTAGDDRFTVIANAANVGFYRNFERAMRHVPADADVVALCDQDDVWDADKLATLLTPLADPAVTMAYGDMRLIDGAGRLLASSVWDQRVNQCDDLASLLILNTVTGAAGLVRADLVRDMVLPFPPGTPSTFHDQWLAACALAAGRIEFVDRPVQSYRQHGANVTGWRPERLDTNLPGPMGWLGLWFGADWFLSEQQRAELGAVTEYELRRIAQFAGVLLLRAGEAMPQGVRSMLAGLAVAERRPGTLVRRLVAGLRGPAVTAGGERRLLAAALRSTALRRHQRRTPRRTG